ncbi:hypothetical protein MRX96_049143 [Rhipicephalus microplus]
MGGAALSSRQCQEGGTRVTYHCCRLRKEVSELICREINRSSSAAVEETLMGSRRFSRRPRDGAKQAALPPNHPL